MVLSVAEGSTNVDNNVIVENVRLLAYAFISANSVLRLTRDCTPFSHKLHSHKEVDDGNGSDFEEFHDGDDENDEEDVICN